MFVRKKKNRSGTTSIVVVDKHGGKFKELHTVEDGLYHERLLDNVERLIVTYSSKRAAKDTFNRMKGVERLKASYASGKITKEKLNKRGYAKFLKIENDVRVSIDEDKIKEDEKWDGLKGYVTNTKLPSSEVVA